MPLMNRDDVQHLADLARIDCTETELDRLQSELGAIVEYVSVISEIASTTEEPAPGARYNVFRADVVTNEPDQYTEAILQEMPKTDGRYLEVKKILNTGD